MLLKIREARMILFYIVTILIVISVIVAFIDSSPEKDHDKKKG